MQPERSSGRRRWPAISASRKGGSELQERLAAIVESSDDAILSKDLEGIIRPAGTGSAERLLRLHRRRNCPGNIFPTLAAPDRVDEILIFLTASSALGSAWIITKTKAANQGRRIPDRVLTVSPIRDGSGKIIGASKVARDMTGLGTARSRPFARAERSALTRSNADLQQFAYSASPRPARTLAHGLNLQRVAERENSAPNAGSDGTSISSLAVQGACGWNAFKRDLRAYTQKYRHRDRSRTEDIDANQILDKALANLEAGINDSGAIVTRTALPESASTNFSLT